MENCQNPCLGCTRVHNPNGCENKLCKEWKAWFLRRWSYIHGYGQQYGIGKKGVCHEVEK